MRNVSRAWAFETGLAVGFELGSGLFVLFSSLLLLTFLQQRFRLTNITNTLAQTTSSTSDHRIWRTLIIPNILQG